jgi:hypothetical protein
MAFLLWSTAAIVRATAAIAPQAWRRSLALALDGLRAEAAHPLPVGPLTEQEVHRAMIGLGSVSGRRPSR